MFDRVRSKTSEKIAKDKIRNQIKFIAMCNHCSNTIETLERITTLGRTITYNDVGSYYNV